MASSTNSTPAGHTVPNQGWLRSAIGLGALVAVLVLVSHLNNEAGTVALLVLVGMFALWILNHQSFVTGLFATLGAAGSAL